VGPKGRVHRRRATAQQRARRTLGPDQCGQRRSAPVSFSDGV